MPSINGVLETPSKADCETYAEKNWIMQTGEVSKTFAQQCEKAYPDTYVAETWGKRKVKFWYVDYTWEHWWNKFWA
jgi:hypothetical protein